MSEWVIKPSYKLDLACFCNLFFKSEMGIERHKEGYEKFRDIMDARQDLIEFANSMIGQGFLIGCGIATVLSLTNYEGYDIDVICQIFDDKQMHSVVEKYISDQGMPNALYELMEPIFPKLSEMLRYVHNNGFLEYWQTESLPAIQKKIRGFEELSVQYPIITHVNELLGFESIKQDFITLYLCSFVAPYGVGLKNAFISDIRWNFKDTVAIAVHEMIHPPFPRQKIRVLTEALWLDEFLREGKDRLSTSSGYHLPEDFVEENLVEGTHIYLSELLGVEENPLKYLIEHDNASHVLSVVLYDALKNGIRKLASTIEEAVDLLLKDGTIRPGNLRKKYMEIYSKAGMANQVPYK